MSESNDRPSLLQLKKMCGQLPIRPLVSKHTAEISFEACAGVAQDPSDGKYKKLRKTFGSQKYGSVEVAFQESKRWVFDARHALKKERNAVFAIPFDKRPIIAFWIRECEKYGIDIEEVFLAGIETVRGRKLVLEVTVNEAVAECKARKGREDCSDLYLRDLNMFYGMFSRDFGDCKMHEITAVQIEKWLDAKDIGATTWNNYRRLLSVLWNMALEGRHGWATENIVKEIKERKVKHDEVSALTVPQAKTILATAHAEMPRLIPYLVVGMFAGLRRSEAEVARWEDIDWETKAMRVTGGKMRGVSSRYVQLCDAFVSWLEPFKEAEGSMCTGPFARRDDIRQLRELTFPFDSNIFRHTFGSYHYHFHQNPQKTIVEMGHTSVEMLHKHYRKPVAREVAARFWELKRANVLKEGGAL